MNWFWIAMIAPFLWAIVVIIDKFLVINYSKGDQSSGGLVIFSSLVNIFVASGILIIVPGIFDVSFIDKIILLSIGVATAIWFVLYLYAIEKEAGSVVSAWFLSVPVFSYPISYFILRETLKTNQIIGSLIVIIGLLFLSLDFDKNKKIKIKSKRSIFYMTFACIIVALCGVMFKYVTVDGNFWVSSFWEYLGLGSAGVFMFLFIPKYRKEFMYMNKKGGIKIFFLNILNESLTIGGNLLTYFVMLTAPISLVYMVGSFQPIIVLFLVVFFKKILPGVINENLTKKILIRKFISILIITVGSLFLFI